MPFKPSPKTLNKFKNTLIPPGENLRKPWRTSLGNFSEDSGLRNAGRCPPGGEQAAPARLGQVLRAEQGGVLFTAPRVSALQGWRCPPGGEQAARARLGQVLRAEQRGVLAQVEVGDRLDAAAGH